ncbi:MAG: glycogen synthase GlgA [Acidobacteriia bacterium]|nr:glycogen synthase GlgA [Terriglobia bacterium]
MNILMVASEATPFAKTGGLADVIGSLPAALAARGERVAVVIPGYRQNVYPNPPREAYRSLWIPLGPGYVVSIFQTTERGVDFYFVHCPALFDRDGIYGHVDDFMRFAVLSKAALGVARYLFRPEVIHCHDWQSALVPVYMAEHLRLDPTYSGVKVLFTIHNLGYQGMFGRETLAPIGLDPRLFNPEQLEFFGKVNYLKGGIAWSDAVSTVSKGYAREIQTRAFGFGLDDFLHKHGPVAGILNGVDYSEWNPEHDPNIAAHYSADDLAGKRECKRTLLAELGLPAGLDRPLAGIVSRFAAQKGFDLISEIASRLLEEDLSLAVIGSGDAEYESMFRSLAESYPDKVAVRIGYDDALAHRIEAGSDMFLMPSQYEPCGLNQIYSLRYGTVPVVRATGGLDDTIDEETGFKFREYSGSALLDAIRSALAAYQDRAAWVGMMRSGMRKDFSWGASAAEYAALYRRLRAESF